MDVETTLYYHHFITFSSFTNFLFYLISEKDKSCVCLGSAFWSIFINISLLSRKRSKTTFARGGSVLFWNEMKPFYWSIFWLTSFLTNSSFISFGNNTDVRTWPKTKLTKLFYWLQTTYASKLANPGFKQRAESWRILLLSTLISVDLQFLWY